MSATGNFLDASTALDWGLVNHLVAHEELLDTATRLASEVADNDPEAVAHVLQTYDAEPPAPGAKRWRWSPAAAPSGSRAIPATTSTPADVRSPSGVGARYWPDHPAS